MLLYLSILTLLFSFVLVFFNRKKNPNQLFLSGFFIITSCFGVAHHFVFQSQDVFWIAVFFNHFVPLMFLIGPLLYFYVRGALEPNRPYTIWHIHHLIFPVWSLIGTIPYYIKPFSEKEAIAKQLIQSINDIRLIDVNLFYDAGESFMMRTILCLLYSLGAGILVIRKYRSLSKRESKIDKQELQVIRWLTVLLSSVFGISLIFILLAFQVAHYEIKDIIKNQTEIYVLSGIIYLILTLSLLQFPNVLYGLSPKKIKEDHQEAATEVETKPVKTYKKKVKYIGTPLERITQYLEVEKPYLSRDFSVFSMAVAIGLAETQINNCIKNEMKTSFVKLRTQLRVNYALSLLENKSNDKITIEAIGEQSGFKTRSNFYAAFKEVTGLTPTEFIQNK